MTQTNGEALRTDPVLHRVTRERDAITRGRNKLTEHEVVSQIFPQAAESANVFENRSLDADQCAESEFHSLQHARCQYPTEEFGVHADCFKHRPEAAASHG